MPRRPLLAVLLSVALLVVSSGCSADDTRVAPRSTSTTARATPDLPVYVAVGASETVGVGAEVPATQAWPQVLHDTALPDSRLVNVGVSGATVTGALEGQLPAALAADPNVVTVWLAVNDVLARVPVAAYEQQLRELLTRLRGGDTHVLVANVPPLWRLPVYRACLPPGPAAGEAPCQLPYVLPVGQVRATVAAFNAAIARVAADTGATLVDLSRERRLTRLVAADGFHPSTAGHHEIAAAFAARLAS